MKKLLAMVLALVMTLSLAVSANAFTDDSKVNDSYAEAVAVLNGMGVFKGYEDGSFKPEGDITRAEVATIVYRIYTADVAKNDKSGLYATYNKFSDMAGASWAAGYIGYCANAELVKGYPDGTFKPSGKVTGYEVLAMILRAVGYDKNGEFSGADWALHVAQTAQQAGMLKNVKGVDLNTAASRELVAELLFRGIQTPTVTYTPAFGYVTDKVIGTATNSLGEKNFKLDKEATSDDWGRPGTKWTYTTGDKSTTVLDKPTVTYTKAVAECDVAHDAGLSKDAAYTLYVNGQKQPVKYTVNLTDTKTKMGAQGRLFEVYDDVIVMIDTFLAKVTYVAPAAYDAQGHLRTDATIKLDVYDDANGASHKLTLTNGEDAYPYAVDDYVLVNAWTNSTNSSTVSGLVLTSVTEGKDYYGEIVAKATSVDGAQSVIYWNAQQHNVDGTVYDDAYKFLLDNAKQNTNKYTWFFDQYNNLIGSVELTSTSTYGVINSIWWAGNAADGSGVAKANVTYMDGTTGVIDISEMTYDSNSVANDNPYTGYGYVSADVAHSTATGKLMQIPSTANEHYFYVDSSLDTNTNVDKLDGSNKILNGHLFQFNTKDNGTVSAVEVSGKGVAVEVSSGVKDSNFTKFHAEKIAIDKLLQWSDGSLIVNANTTFLVRSGKGTTPSPYTFKSVVGYANIDKHEVGEVDFVDLNGDKVADYVYIIADADSTKVTSTFFYDGAQKAYTISNTTWAIPGYVDGVEKTIYADTYESDFVSKLASDTLYTVALENDSVMDYKVLATLGTATVEAKVEPISATYPLADVYGDYSNIKVISIVGEDGDDFNGTVYNDGDTYYAVNAEEGGLTKMPLALGNAADQNVIVVYNKYTGRNLALQVFAKDQVNTPDNPTTEKTVAVTNATWTYTLNGKYVTPATVYTCINGGTAKDALNAAVANAQELSLNGYGAAVSGMSHTFAANGLQHASVVVYPNGTTPATVNAGGVASVSTTLEAGDIIVIADDNNTTAAATYYAAFVVVD